MRGDYLDDVFKARDPDKNSAIYAVIVNVMNALKQEIASNGLGAD